MKEIMVLEIKITILGIIKIITTSEIAIMEKEEIQDLIETIKMDLIKIMTDIIMTEMDLIKIITNLVEKNL